MLLAALALVLTFEDASGTKIELDQPGTVYLVDFWAEGCKPCLEEMPELERLARDLEPQGRFKLVSVLWGGWKGEQLTELAERRGIERPVYSDPENWLDEVGKAVFPTKVLVRDGAILETRVGGERRGRGTYAYWKQRIEEALKPSAPQH